MNNYFQGVRALEQRDYPRAIGFFSRALAIDPADVDSQAERGFAHLRAGDLEQARQDCQAVLRRNAAHPRGCELRAWLSPENPAEQRAAQPATESDEGDRQAGSQPCARAGSGEAVLCCQATLAGNPADANQPVLSLSAETVASANFGASADSGLQLASPAALARGVSPLATEPLPEQPLAESHTTPSTASADTYELAQIPSEREPAKSAEPLAATQGISALDEQPVATGAAHWTLRSVWGVARAGLASTAVHAAVLLALAMAVVHAKAHSEPLLVVATTMPASAGRAEPFVFAPSQGDEVTGPLMAVGATMVSARFSSMPRLDMTPKIESRTSGTLQLALVERGVGTEVTTELLREYQPKQTTELADLRSAEGRRAAVMARGGTPESEAAVERALAWLVRHQNYDGSWNFDHRFCGDCKGACANPGVLPQAQVGATAMALLPFLGAGHTHIVDKYGAGNKYGKHVLSGLRFLIRSMRHDGGMNEPTGRMYDHGLASIVLCEAYAMTQDRMLLKPAQRALGFIVDAQDPVGGGWRYQPRMPGDTSVVGWQLMAIKSGQMAYLRVPQETINGVSRFLDYVAISEGAGYGYVDSNYGTEATSAVGLLCRMYLGWKRDHPALTRGVQTLSALQPSTSNMYFNYYATQVLHHYEGPLWGKWNTAMRDYLVRSQSDRGHQSGSWYFDGDKHNRIGGRLYCTALAAMTLEVYYRHMPLYSKRAVIDKLGQ